MPDPPKHFLNQLEKDIFNFIWSGKPDKIKRTVLINPISSGGLGAIHLTSFLQGLKCTWVKRFLDNSGTYWKLFFDYYLDDFGKSLLFRCNYKNTDVVVNNVFLMNVCQAWSSCTYSTLPTNIKDQIIWNNSCIKIDDNIVFYKSWYDKGIVCIKDFYDNNNQALSFTCFKSKFNLQMCPFTKYFGIISAIPKQWKRVLNYPIVDPVEPPLFDVISVISSTSRYIYKLLVKKIGTPPTCIDKWNLHCDFSESQWRLVFQIPFHSLRDCKTRYFQYRFIHRILGTNYLLLKMQLKENNLCTFCKDSEETLEHLFWECTVTSKFILDVEQNILGSQFVFSKKDVFSVTIFI